MDHSGAMLFWETFTVTHVHETNWKSSWKTMWYKAVIILWMGCHQKCQCVHVISFVSLLVGNTSGCMKIKGPGMVLPSMVPVKVAPKPLSAQLSSTFFNVVRYRNHEKSNYFLPSQNLQRRVWVAGLCLAKFWSPSNMFHQKKTSAWINQGFKHWPIVFPCWYHEGLFHRFCIFSLPLPMNKGSRIRGRKTIFPTAMGRVYNYSGIHRIFQTFQNGGTGIRQSLKNIWQNWNIHTFITLTCSTAPDNRCELVDVSRLYN